ncbi:MAG: hypothetical protein J5737_07715 [Bacteroidales bacterium]|nr:hypothetical protein [Bacteroidales bacterium]
MNKDSRKNRTVYSDGRYTLGKEDGLPYIIINGSRYRLTCHPYEPCLYITDELEVLTAVHNAFDPDSVLREFAGGRTVTSITGREYDAADFCRMVEYASGMVDIQIDYAEKVFGDRPKKKNPQPEKKKKDSFDGKECRPESGRVIENDPAYDVIARYPDSVVDYCIVQSDPGCHGRNEHWTALVWASVKLFIDVDDEVIWHYDAAKADARQISVRELFAPVSEEGMNYRKAFLRPPYPNGYTDADFDCVNAALFPNGTEGLEVFEWTTGWSEYFDEGHEWWGTLCLTVLDKTLDRIVVIMASATD